MIWRRRKVRIHFKVLDAPAVEGILIEKSREYLVLVQHAVVVAPDTSFESQGEAWIPRGEVLWVQAL